MVLALMQMILFLTQKVEIQKNVIIFGADLSSSVHANNRKNNLLVLGKGFSQGLNGTTIYKEGSVYPTNFTEQDLF